MRKVTSKHTEQEKALQAVTDPEKKVQVLLEIIASRPYEDHKMDTAGYLEMLKALGEKLKSKEVHAWYLNYKALKEHLTGEIQQSLENAKASLKIFSEIDHITGQARTCNGIGANYRFLNDPDSALKYYRKALELFNDTGDKQGIAKTYNNIGIIFKSKGEYENALKNAFYSLNLFEELGDNKGIADVSIGIGNIHFIKGNFTRAMQYYVDVKRIGDKLNNKFLIALASGNIGAVHGVKENYKDAATFYNKALKISKETKDPYGTSRMLHHLGTINAYNGNYKTALEYLNQALEIRQEINDLKGIAECFQYIGVTEKYRKNYQEALKYLSKALEIRVQINNKNYLANSKIQIGKCHVHLENFEEAERYLCEGLEIADELGQKFDVKDAIEGMYELRKAEKNYSEALQLHEKLAEKERALELEDIDKNIIEVDQSFRLEKKEQELQYYRKKRQSVQIAYNWLEKENAYTQSILRNLLPERLMPEFEDLHKTFRFTEITVMYVIFENGRNKSRKADKSPDFLLERLKKIITRYNLKEIKVNYNNVLVAASGIHKDSRKDHASNAVAAAIEIMNLPGEKGGKVKSVFPAFKTGVHTGKISGKITGFDLLDYHIPVNTISIASLIANSAKNGEIFISMATKSCTKKPFNVDQRSTIKHELFGEIETFHLVNSELGKDRNHE